MRTFPYALEQNGLCKNVFSLLNLRFPAAFKPGYLRMDFANKRCGLSAAQ